jgi:hypothetical protein
MRPKKGGGMLKRIPFFFLSILVFCSLLPLDGLGGDRFTDNGDGTVTDHLLQVMWAKNDNQGDINWKEAQQWVRYTFPFTLNTHYQNWRLPTLAELKSLYVDKRKYQGYETDCGQWVKMVPEIRLSCGWVWTSEKSAIQATVFNFHRGYHYKDRMVHKKAYRVLPLRPLK